MVGYPHQCPRQASVQSKDPGTMSRSGHQDINHLRILSANLRGFLTNDAYVRELTHDFVLPNRIDIVATVETFLNDSVPSNYGQILGFTQWLHRDRVDSCVRRRSSMFPQRAWHRASLHQSPNPPLCFSAPATGHNGKVLSQSIF